jgi:ubiquinone biosynthesis protein UbiJ
LRGDSAYYRNILDDLRFSLEQLLKSLLRNDKSLENQKDILGAWLKGKGVHVQIRSLYAHLANCFSQYQNNAVKHAEDYSETEVEFMIYLTGTLMRLLLELEQTSSAPEGKPS